ncbi:MAG TPA: FxLYD domain-containing protein [Steroidobacteraceae bacterium]|nr:FxLYD domain-containing protein [Steroidobacteraceae bacterium]
MSAQRPSVAGKTRACPHCKATILESASVCPACRHYLRFDAAAQPVVSPSVQAFRVEGVIRNHEPSRHWEYAVVVTIRNERGEEVRRQVVNVGALEPQERRTFTVAVEMSGGSGPANSTG